MGKWETVLCLSVLEDLIQFDISAKRKGGRELEEKLERLGKRCRGTVPIFQGRWACLCQRLLDQGTDTQTGHEAGL